MSTENVENDNTKDYEAPAQPKKEKLKKSIIGSYMLTRQLGEGAFGKVREGTNTFNNESVAVKILEKAMILENDDEDDLIRVQQEISILKKLKHKNVVQLYEIIDTEKNLYLVTELCENGELYDQVLLKKRLEEPEACKYFQDIIDGLDYLHSQQIVHRDIKLENLLLDSRMNVKITDFGLSKIYPKNGLLYTYRGTYAYCPPEFFAEGEEGYKGELSDVWSSGVVLYTMLQGYLPFTEVEQNDNIEKIVAGDYEMPDDISELAKDLIGKMLCIDPLERISIKKIKKHPWFNLITPKLLKGIVVGFHKIPVDESVLGLVEAHGFLRETVREKLLGNVHDKSTGLYYLYIKKKFKEGKGSVSDFRSEEFVKYINDPSNLLPQADLNSENNNDFLCEENENENEAAAEQLHENNFRNIREEFENRNCENIETVYLKEDVDENENEEQEEEVEENGLEAAESGEDVEQEVNYENEEASDFNKSRGSSAAKNISNGKNNSSANDQKRNSENSSGRNSDFLNKPALNGSEANGDNIINKIPNNSEQRKSVVNNKKESIKENARYTLDDNSLAELENYIKSVNLNLHLNLNLNLNGASIDNLANEPKSIGNNVDPTGKNFRKSNYDSAGNNANENRNVNISEDKKKNNNSGNRDNKNTINNNKNVLKKRASDGIAYKNVNKKIKLSPQNSANKIRRSSLNDKISKVTEKKYKHIANYNTLENPNLYSYNVFSKLENEIKNIAEKKNPIKANLPNNTKKVNTNYASNYLYYDSLKLKNPLTADENSINNNRKKFRNSSVSYRCENKLLDEYKKDLNSNNNNSKEEAAANFKNNNKKDNKPFTRRLSQPLNNEKATKYRVNVTLNKNEKSKKATIKTPITNDFNSNNNNNNKETGPKRNSNLAVKNNNNLNKNRKSFFIDKESAVPRNFKQEKKSVVAEIIEREKEFLLKKKNNQKLNQNRLSQIVDAVKISKIIKQRLSCFEKASFLEQTKLLTDENTKKNINENLSVKSEHNDNQSISRTHSKRYANSNTSSSEDASEDNENPKEECDKSKNRKKKSIDVDLKTMIDDIIKTKFKDKRNSLMNFYMAQNPKEIVAELDLVSNAIDVNAANNFINEGEIPSSKNKKKITFEEKEKLLENIISNIKEDNEVKKSNIVSDNNNALVVSGEIFKEEKLSVADLKIEDKNAPLAIEHPKIEEEKQEIKEVKIIKNTKNDVMSNGKKEMKKSRKVSMDDSKKQDSTDKKNVKGFKIKNFEEKTAKDKNTISNKVNNETQNTKDNANKPNLKKQREVVLNKNSSLPKETKNSEASKKTEIQTARNKNLKETASNFNFSSNVNDLKINPEKAKIGNFTERKPDKKLVSTDRNFDSNRASLTNLNPAGNDQFKPKNTFSNYMANIKSKINKNTIANNKTNITTNLTLNKTNYENNPAMSHRGKDQNKAPKSKFTAISKNGNLTKKFSEESPDKAKEKEENHLNKFKKVNVKNTNIGNYNNNTFKTNILTNDVQVKKEKLKLISNANYDSDYNMNNRNNQTSVSHSPNRSLTRNLSLSQNKTLLPIVEKVQILPWKIKKTILEEKANKNFYLEKPKANNDLIIFEASKAQDISFTNEKSKSNSKIEREKSHPNALDKIYLQTDRNQISSNLHTLKNKENILLSKEKGESNNLQNQNKNKKRFVNLTLDLSKIKMSESKQQNKNYSFNNTERNLNCKTEINEHTDLKQDDNAIFNQDPTFVFNNFTSREKMSLACKNEQLPQNRELHNYHLFKNKIQKQIERLKVKVNQNEFKKNIRLKYQLQFLRQQNHEKLNKLSKQFHEMINLNTNKTLIKYTRQSSLPTNIECNSRNYSNYYVLNTNENIGKSTENFEKLNHTLFKNLSFENKTLNNEELSVRSKNNLNKEFFQFMNDQNEDSSINNNEIIELKNNLVVNNTKNLNRKVHFSPQQIENSVGNNPFPKSLINNNKNYNSFLDNYAESYKKQYLNTSANNRKGFDISNEYIENESNNQSALNADNDKSLNPLAVSNEKDAKIYTLNSTANKKTDNYKSNYKKINLYEKFQEKKLKELDNIETYSGPIDDSFIIENSNVILIMERLGLFLQIKKISFVKLSKYKYLCNHENLNFDITLLRMDKAHENFHYLKMKMNKPIKVNNQGLLAENKEKLKPHNNTAEFKNLSKSLIAYLNNGVL